MQQANEKKYIILENETLEHHGKTLYRIQAVKDFSDVKAGDKGGWIEREKNLSQEGDCWVHNEAKVYNNAQVFGEAKVGNYARIWDSAIIHGNAIITQHANVHEYANVFGNTQVYGYADLYGNAYIFGTARIFGNVEIYGFTRIFGTAIIKEKNDYTVFKNIWSTDNYLTYTKSNRMWCTVSFYGDGERIIEHGYRESELSGKMYETYVNLVKEQAKIEEKLSKS